MNTPYSNTACIWRIVKWSDQHLRSTLQLLRSRNVLYNTIQQRHNTVRLLFPVRTHPVILGRTIDCRKIKLLFGSIQAEHQVEDHLVYFVRTTVRFVYLINNNNRFQSDFQSFLQHKARLRHRAFKSINQQNASVGHVEHTLYFATEVAVSRSINNINLSSVVIDRNVFREDRYPSFTLQVVVIQN